MFELFAVTGQLQRSLIRSTAKDFSSLAAALMQHETADSPILHCLCITSDGDIPLARNAGLICSY